MVIEFNGTGEEWQGATGWEPEMLSWDAAILGCYGDGEIG